MPSKKPASKTEMPMKPMHKPAENRTGIKPPKVESHMAYNKRKSYKK